MSETDDLRALMEADRWIDRVDAQKTHLPEHGRTGRARDRTARAVEGAERRPGRAGPGAHRPTKRPNARASGFARAPRASTRTCSNSTANARDLAALQTELQHVRELLERSDDLELEYLMAVEPLDEAVNAVKVGGATGRRASQPNCRPHDHRTPGQSRRRTGRASRNNARSARRPSRPNSSLVTRRPSRASGTSGAAQVVAGHCDGCRIALSPLDLDRWKGQPDGTFMTCPECGRLLVAVIILIRHGQTTSNAARLLVGQSDPALTELGERQARALRPYLRDVREVWTSPLRRARAHRRARAARISRAIVKETFIEVELRLARRSAAEPRERRAVARLRARSQHGLRRRRVARVGRSTGPRRTGRAAGRSDEPVARPRPSTWRSSVTCRRSSRR